MNIDRPRIVALSLQLLGSKKLKELRPKVSHLCDSRLFTHPYDRSGESDDRTLLNMNEVVTLCRIKWPHLCEREVLDSLLIISSNEA